MAEQLDLLTALKTKWDTVAELTAFSGPYQDEKPSGTSVGFPYVVIENTNSHKIRQSTHNTYWLHTFDLTVRAATVEQVRQHMKTIGEKFDINVTPALPLGTGNGTVVRVDRTDGDAVQEDKQVAKGTISYEIETSKLR